MKQRSLLALATVLLLVAGCASIPSRTSAEEDVPDSTRASIYVDGDERGVTPATLRIRRHFDGTRSFGATIITLRQGQDVVRTFEVEHLYNPNSAELHYRAGEPRLSLRTYRVDELPTQDSIYVIPYFSRSIVVEDPRYRLELIVED